MLSVKSIIKSSLIILMVVMAGCDPEKPKEEPLIEKPLVKQPIEEQLFVVRSSDTYSLLAHRLDNQKTDYYHGSDEWWDQYPATKKPDFIEDIDIRNLGLDNFGLFFSKSGKLCHVVSSIMIKQEDKEKADKVIKQFTEYFSHRYGNPVKNFYYNNAWTHNDIKIAVIPSVDKEFNDVIVEFWLKQFNECYPVVDDTNSL